MMKESYPQVGKLKEGNRRRRVRKMIAEKGEERVWLEE
jgi:hypothetical protein